ncbi:MAG: hypothetical protein AB1427_21820 [Thermodesulfobacteriota bacterium]
MNPKIVKADKAYRRTIVIILLLIVLGGLSMFQWLVPWANKAVHQIDPQKGLVMVRYFLVGMFLAIVAISAYLAFFGRNVLKNRKFPPPGVKVLVDTRLVEGEPAIIRGQLILLASLLLFIFSFYGVLVTLYKIFLTIKR